MASQTAGELGTSRWTPLGDPQKGHGNLSQSGHQPLKERWLCKSRRCCLLNSWYGLAQRPRESLTKRFTQRCWWITAIQIKYHPLTCPIRGSEGGGVSPTCLNRGLIVERLIATPGSAEPPCVECWGAWNWVQAQPKCQSKSSSVARRHQVKQGSVAQPHGSLKAEWQ